MISGGLLALLAATGMRMVRLIPPEGAPLPQSVEIEWLGATGESISIDERPITRGMIALDEPTSTTQSLRAVGPDVISLPIAWSDREAGLRLHAAGRLRLTGIPEQVAKVRVFMELEQSNLAYMREIPLGGAAELEFAAPLGTYSVAVDLGPDRSPLVFAHVEIGRGHAATRVRVVESSGRKLDLLATKKEDGSRISGASIRGAATPSTPAVLWRALEARCGTSDLSGLLSCGVVPATLNAIDVIAPRRRRAHVPLLPQAGGNEQPIKAVLAPYQDVRVALTSSRRVPAKLLERLTAVLSGARCTWSGCDDGKAPRKEMGPSRSVTFAQLEPGTYRVWLEGSKARSSTKPVVVSDDSAAPDVVMVPLQLNLWQVTGSTHLPDGVGVPAAIWFGTFKETAPQQELAGIVHSDPSGAFDTFLLAEPGAYLWAHAVARKPAAEGEVTPPGIQLLEGDEHVALDIEISTSGAAVKLVDKKTNDAIPDCKVAFYHWGEKSGGSRFVNSDADGIARWVGISKGTFVARAMCDGYRTASTEKIDLATEPEVTTLELEPAGAVSLRVRDAEGNPLPGASVSLEQSAFDAAYPFQIPAERLGVTDFDGLISIPARPRNGFYVIAPGHALFAGRVTACSNRSGCVQEVQLFRPTAFPCIVVRDAEGAPASAAWLVFYKDGVAIPVSVQNELIAANDMNASPSIIREGADTVHMLPSLFGPGVYDVQYAKARPGSAPELVPLTMMAIPATHRIELKLPAPRLN